MKPFIKLNGPEWIVFMIASIFIPPLFIINLIIFLCQAVPRVIKNKREQKEMAEYNDFSVQSETENDKEIISDRLSYPSKLTQSELAGILNNPLILELKAHHFAFKEFNIEYTIPDDYLLNIFDTNQGIESLRNDTAMVLGSYACQDKPTLRIVRQTLIDLELFKNMELNGLEPTSHCGIQKTYRFRIMKNCVMMLLWYNFQLYNISLTNDNGNPLTESDVQNYKKQLLEIERTFNCAQFIKLTKDQENKLLSTSLHYMRCFGGQYYDYLINFAHGCITGTATKLMLKKLHKSLSTAIKGETDLIKLRDTYYYDITDAKNIAEKYLELTNSN